MGYARVELIPPAVLHMNPGVTREEYLELLEDIPFTLAEFYDSNKDWDDVEMGEFSLVNDGLEELGRVLNLSFTNEYKEFQSNEEDEKGLIIESPRKEYDYDDDDIYRVQNHQENKIVKDGIVELSVVDGLEEGDVYRYGQNYKVKDIIEEKETGSDEMRTYYDYKINALVFRKIYDEDVFETKEEMWEKWPQFHPVNIFDWSQNRGNFQGKSSKFYPSKFIWKQKKGEYCLDEETFEKIPASWVVSNMNDENDMYGACVGYTDFIVTLEGLERNAWKLFASGGMQHLEDFFEDFPEAKERHDKAVWDFYTSSHAKNTNMSISDFLRYRLLNSKMKSNRKSSG